MKVLRVDPKLCPVKSLPLSWIKLDLAYVCVFVLLCCPDSAFPSASCLFALQMSVTGPFVCRSLCFFIWRERSFKLTSPRFLVERFCSGAVNKVKCLSYLKHSVHDHQCVSSEKCHQNMSKLCETIQFCHLQWFYLVSQTLCI